MRDLKEKWIGLIKTKKGKGILLGVVIIILVILVGVLYINKDKTLQLNKETVKIEYGKTYNPNLKDIVKSYDDFNSKDLKLESTIKNEEGKEYPSVGKYEVKVTYKKQEVTQKVEVKDTTKPELTVPENIEILQGTDLSTFDFKSLLNATDLSELKDYEIDYSKVDANTVGEYEVNVSIQDKYENKTDAKVKATVIEKPTINDDEVVVQEVVTNEDGTKTVKNSVKKQAEATDKKVVSNSNNTNKNTANSSATTGGSTSTPHIHVTVGTSGMWVNSVSEVIAKYHEVSDEWSNKLESGEIDWNTYSKNCPVGYTNIRECSCGKLTWDWVK